ncbi:hypothetical protein MHU86_11916 [Fragilaria crotonensis]|nr:hypothetical protein MHU86_11916 [Fragilaria crotonensis]
MTTGSGRNQPGIRVGKPKNRTRLSSLFCACLVKSPPGDEVVDTKSSEVVLQRSLRNEDDNESAPLLRRQHNSIEESPTRSIPVLHGSPKSKNHSPPPLPASPQSSEAQMTSNDVESKMDESDESSLNAMQFILLKAKAIPEHILIEQTRKSTVADDETELSAEDLTFVEKQTWNYNPTPSNPAKYSGPVFCNDIPHGSGILEFENGDTYEGPFHMGLMHGPSGTFKTTNGSIYIGGFSENLKHGHGTQTVTGKPQRFSGNFQMGIPHGYGEAYSADGSLFHRGQWDNGRPSHSMIPFTRSPGVGLGDDESVKSASIVLPCDASFGSTIEPRVSMYDPFRRTLMYDDDDSSVASKSCFSEISFSIMEGDTAFYVEEEEDDESLYQRPSSILGIGPVNESVSELTSKLMRLPAIDMTKYASLKDSLEDHRRPEGNMSGDSVIASLDPSDLYRGAFDQA